MRFWRILPKTNLWFPICDFQSVISNLSFWHATKFEEFHKLGQQIVQIALTGTASPYKIGRDSQFAKDSWSTQAVFAAKIILHLRGTIEIFVCISPVRAKSVGKSVLVQFARFASLWNSPNKHPSTSTEKIALIFSKDVISTHFIISYPRTSNLETKVPSHCSYFKK